MQKQPYRHRKGMQNISTGSIKLIQKSLISSSKDTISLIQSLGNIIMYYPTSQLDKKFKNKQNNSLPFLATSPLKPPAIDSNLSNTPNSFKTIYKPLSLAIYPPETSMIESKQSNGINSLNKK